MRSRRAISPRAAVRSDPTQAQFDGAMSAVKRQLDILRAACSKPVQVGRVRRTRTGWAVIYRLGDGPEQAFRVDARSSAVLPLTPDDARLP
jgi:hypothetical protein